ncbi:uncharacterized protein (TIGR04255 family) [Sphingobium xenophagum]|uniref:Uncharacterized protein (TIGR04255 family) n=1 Tax=Sphingobium xenophagum TaxID=121428 RepID=A0ABU1WW36_SPHXE|nr:TIGR04255 family protein [Sphingobium xenophagum]MDR7153279.1 uncharacterized protein (TIGR04255 family) [Sphingobium xenophagum]
MAYMTEAKEDVLYPRAPIVEAVMELRFEDVAVSRLRNAADAIQAQYENRETDKLFEGNLNFEARSSSFKEISDRFRFSSWDQTDLLILTSQAAIWSRLAPYEGWAQFCGRIAEQLPKIYKNLGRPKLTRLGLRYINRIDVPLGADNVGYHENYLTFRIVADDILDPTDGFQWALTKKFPAQDLAVNVQSANVVSELPRHSAVSFDIDVFTLVDVPNQVDDILEKLGDMRRLKNEIFETGITDEARKLFNAADD